MGGIIAISIFLAVFIATLLVYYTIKDAIQTYKERYDIQSIEDITNIALFIDRRSLLTLNLAAMLMGIMGGLLFIHTAGAILLGAGFFFIPYILINYYQKKRVKKFNLQLVDALSMMSNCFKAGLTFQQAMDHLVKEFQAPLALEFDLTLKELRLGVSLDDALDEMVKRVGSEDLELLVTSTNISRQMGGNLAEIFDLIAATIRERFRLEGKVQSLTAQGKLQGIIVSLLPLALGLFMYLYRPDLMVPMLNHWFGWMLIAVIIVMEIIGMILIRRIVNIPI